MTTISDGQALDVLNAIAVTYHDRERWDETDEVYVHRYGLEPISVVGEWIDRVGGDVGQIEGFSGPPDQALELAGLKVSPLILALLAEIQFKEEQGAWWGNAVMHAKDRLLIRFTDLAATL